MAGTNQGGAFLGLEPKDYEALHLIGLSVGQGIPTNTPGQGGMFEGRDVPLTDLTGSRTNTDRSAISKAAPTDRGGASEGAGSQGSVDWYDDVHLLPRGKVKFGNIITQQTQEYELYSAYRNNEVTLSTIDNNVTPGVTLPDESPPEIVPAQSSMLDNTTTDNTGDTIALGTMVKRSYVVEAKGLSLFDGTIDFSFDTGDAVSLLLSGSRIVLLPLEYEAPVQETLAFLTDIIEALDGHEQRIALRKQPRQLFEVLYRLDTNDRQRMQLLLMDWQDQTFGFPLWHEKLKLASAVSAGATSYAVSGADDVDLRVGGLAIVFQDVNTFDVITISALTDTLITALDPSVNGYSAGTTIMPLRTARILAAVEGARYTNNLEDFRIQLEVTDNDTGAMSGSTAAYSSYNGRVLFDDCNVITGQTMRQQYLRKIHRIDNDTGVVHTASLWDRGKRSAQKGFGVSGRADIKAFKQVILSLRGRQKAFYVPTFFDDLKVKAELTIGTRTMDIVNIEYARFAQNRLPKTIMKVSFTNGDPALVRTIVSSTKVDSTTERLTFDASESAWPSTYAVADIDRVEFYELVRFDSDNIQITYPVIAQATCYMPVLQVFDDNA